MRVSITAVGRLRAGPEQVLIDDYLKRFDKAARPRGLGPATVREVEDRKGGGMAAEGALLDAAIPDGAFRVMLDERGRQMSSPDFAKRMMHVAEQGRRDMVFVIGGADGLDPALRDTADLKLSFGPMVWPHMLVRVMVAEQLYRAASILGGSPYHRT
ncbi:23S rRNA (pseudouridine(1915)-N(3))-methyltransferase RlmH [Pontivivens insulae]|uniref:Ribosomal RNA large subunit methyltransferase H n=1 Tax=Pontivivens insulae TaxID=1639689 RepID=A0A2R8AD52_9RHOB|nr:23S rRNA (pseudouridine(1915)-N(3))-methyltransferase RlmH [Pontivivens insulae]RED14092.1 23S rRNA (pseudouridine1915-N3)-methyltransferase [Pontivivens insulae]SPF30166.1 Ribosomal RNA large subunit methyltransferase H [Pontivivens insulae]